MVAESISMLVCGVAIAMSLVSLVINIATLRKLRLVERGYDDDLGTAPMGGQE